MSKDNKIKIYTHHSRYLNASTDVNKIKNSLWNKFLSGIFYFFYIIGLVVIKTVTFFKNGFIGACFHTGSLIINSITKTLRAAKNDFLNTKDALPKRFRLLGTRQFYAALSSFLLFALIGYGLLASLNLVAKALGIKAKIMHTALVGNLYLNQAKSALGSQNLGQAENKFALAYQTFDKGQTDIEESSHALNQLLNLIPQKNDADRLLKAASLISEAGQNFIVLEKNIKTLKLNSNGITAGDTPTAEVFSTIHDQLSQAQNKIILANNYVNKVNENSLPGQNRESFLDLKSKLNTATLALTNFSQMFNLAQTLLTGNKKILVLFENNNELRASGGFMGTFGALSVKDGAITKINVSSIYDLDGQLNEKIQPPQPILNVNDRWFLRDSNWFASFPDSAKKISSFYEKEGGETPDTIVAITPNLIQDWLKITGPIILPKYNITLTAENFVEQTQVATTLSENLPTNAPKQILADLVPILLQRLSALDKSAWPNVIQSIQDNLNNKQIAIYSRDSDTQTQLENFNWTGDLRESDRDYLSIVGSNLGGTKTDLFVDQQSSLTSTIGTDGTITNELTITRTNKMPKLDKTNNLSYLRIYVPLGSKLTSNIGFDYKNLDYTPNSDYKIDDDVLKIQKNSVKDMVTGMTIGEESGKTFFGNWLNLDGGETKTVKITYQLPFKVSDIDRYSLMVQKQLGSQNQKFNWTLNFSGFKIAWKNFEPNQLNTSDLNSDIMLDKDYFFGMVLQRR